MTRDSRKSVSRGGKRSKRSVKPYKTPAASDYNSLNIMEGELELEEKREMNNDSIEPIDSPIETSIEKELEKESESEMVKINEIIDEPVDKIDNEEPVVEPPPPAKHQPTSAFQKVFPSNTVPATELKRPRKDSATKTFSQSPMFKYAMIGLGVFMFYFIFIRRSSNKKNVTGPTIVDVTENPTDDKKSVKNSINRISSPRIVFGDLRKNPSLMVAPPMTPLVN